MSEKGKVQYWRREESRTRGKEEERERRREVERKRVG